MDIESYNHELSMLLEHYRLLGDEKALKKEFIEKMTYVVELMHKHNVPKNFMTKARLFEFAAASRNNEYANQMLRQLTLDTSGYPYSLIESSTLQQFYSQSLSSDNFNGLGHLLTYIEKFGVDISQWSLGKFKSALEFYLNHKFNLTNILIFTKYYTHINQLRFRKEARLLDKDIS